MTAATLGFGLATSPANAQNYTLKDLGPLQAGGYSQAYALNNSGDAVGVSKFGNSTDLRAVLWSGASKTNLGTLPGLTWKSGALAINNFGTIVGYTSSASASRAVIFNGATNIDLGTLGGDRSIARGINDLGQVVGRSEGGANSHAFIWEDLNANGVSDPGEMKKLGSMLTGVNSSSGAYDINNAGQVAGFAANVNGYDHAVLVTNGIAKDLGTFGGNWSYAYAVNENGQVVGEAQDSSFNYRAFKYFKAFLMGNGGYGFWIDVRQNLGTLAGYKHSMAFGINNAGLAVGKAGDFRGEIQPTDRALRFDPSGPINLNNRIPTAPGWTLYEAHGINDNGQITGIGKYNGQLHGFLLTPIGRP
jgi:probable HAF family extracellular repeat protein